MEIFGPAVKYLKDVGSLPQPIHKEMGELPHFRPGAKNRSLGLEDAIQGHEPGKLPVAPAGWGEPVIPLRDGRRFAKNSGMKRRQLHA